jgi:hypothetical protein
VLLCVDDAQLIQSQQSSESDLGTERAKLHHNPEQGIHQVCLCDRSDGRILVRLNRVATVRYGRRAVMSEREADGYDGGFRWPSVLSARCIQDS